MIEQKIEQLGKLRDGWDGNGALAPSPEALVSIGFIIKSLKKSVLMHCVLFPANDGGVYLQGRFRNGKLSVYVQKDQMTYVVKTPTQKETAENVLVNRENTARLSDIVSGLFA